MPLIRKELFLERGTFQITVTTELFGVRSEIWNPAFDSDFLRALVFPECLHRGTSGLIPCQNLNNLVELSLIP